MARDIRQYYTGNDDHPVEQAEVADGLSAGAFTQSGGTVVPPTSNTNVAAWAAAGQVFNVSATNQIILPDGNTWTPSGAGQTQANADTRYLRIDEAQTVPNASLARTSLGLGTAATASADSFAASNHNHRANTLEMFSEDVAAVSEVAANTAKVGITPDQASAITANTAKVVITSDQASAIVANTAKTGITSDQASAIAANTTASHAAVTVSGTPDYITLSGQDLVRNQIDLANDVTGTLPLTALDSNALNSRIVAQAATVGSVHRFADNAAFQANTDTWHVGDILIINDTTYLYIGTNDTTSTSLTDFQQITISGGGISQGTADGRYAAINHTHTASQISDFATAVPANTAVAANTAKVGITTDQAAAITANTNRTTITSDQASAITANTAKVGVTTAQASAITANTNKTGITADQASAITTNTAKVTFPGFGTTATTAAAGNHNHDDRYARIDAEDILTAPQRTQFYTNVGAFSGSTFGGAQTDDFTAGAQNNYVLMNIGADRTMTLPSGVDGTQIKIANLSTFNPGAPDTRRNSSTWTIAPHAGERISQLPLNEVLVLDTAKASFTLTYTNAENGWIITGVE